MNNKNEPHAIELITRTGNYYAICSGLICLSPSFPAIPILTFLPLSLFSPSLLSLCLPLFSLSPLYLSSIFLFCMHLLLFSVVLFLFHTSVLPCVKYILTNINYLCVAVGLCAWILPGENTVYICTVWRKKSAQPLILTFNHVLSMPIHYPIAAALLSVSVHGWRLCVRYQLW